MRYKREEREREKGSSETPRSVPEFPDSVSCSGTPDSSDQDQRGGSYSGDPLLQAGFSTGEQALRKLSR